MSNTILPNQYRLVSFFFLFLFACLAPFTVQAQNGPEVIINYIETEPKEEGMKLNIFFNLINDEGVILSGNDIDAASLILDDGTRYIPQVSQPCLLYTSPSPRDS